MSGSDFTKETAKKAIKDALAGYQNSVNNKPPAGPQLGLLSVDLTTATMPDGTVMPVQVIGSPAGIQGGSQGNTGGYAMVFPDGSGGGLAYWPSPRQQITLDGGKKGYVILNNESVADPRINWIIQPLNTYNHYLADPYLLGTSSFGISFEDILNLPPIVPVIIGNQFQIQPAGQPFLVGNIVGGYAIKSSGDSKHLMIYTSVYSPDTTIQFSNNSSFEIVNIGSVEFMYVLLENFSFGNTVIASVNGIDFLGLNSTKTTVNSIVFNPDFLTANLFPFPDTPLSPYSFVPDPNFQQNPPFPPPVISNSWNTSGGGVPFVPVLFDNNGADFDLIGIINIDQGGGNGLATGLQNQGSFLDPTHCTNFNISQYYDILGTGFTGFGNSTAQTYSFAIMNVTASSGPTYYVDNVYNSLTTYTVTTTTIEFPTPCPGAFKDEFIATPTTTLVQTGLAGEFNNIGLSAAYGGWLTTNDPTPPTYDNFLHGFQILTSLSYSGGTRTGIPQSLILSENTSFDQVATLYNAYLTKYLNFDIGNQLLPQGAQLPDMNESFDTTVPAFPELIRLSTDKLVVAMGNNPQFFASYSALYPITSSRFSGIRIVPDNQATTENGFVISTSGKLYIDMISYNGNLPETGFTYIQYDGTQLQTSNVVTSLNFDPLQGVSAVYESTLPAVLGFAGVVENFVSFILYGKGGNPQVTYGFSGFPGTIILK
jgi:hypothetical protein